MCGVGPSAPGGGGRGRGEGNRDIGVVGFADLGGRFPFFGFFGGVFFGLIISE